MTAVDTDAAARALLEDGPPQAALDYCFGAAGDEATMTRNEIMLDRAVLVPRVLPGGPADPSVEVAGGRIAAPLLVAPMGLQALLDPGAETVAARAAAEAGLGFCLSTFSSAAAADVAATGPGLRWRQIYLTREPRLNRYLVEEAERLDFQALVVTLDVPVVGRRERDRANGLNRFTAAPPALLHAEPFRRAMTERGVDAQTLLAEIFPNPFTEWRHVAELVASTALPVLVKGILHADDARRAIDAGAAGIVVSNHGGRQFDRSISSIEALPPIAAAAGPATPVYLDSGVRRPAHVAVALAHGARAVLLGRPVLTALADGQAEAVGAVLRGFASELTHIMTLLGARTPAELTGCARHTGVESVTDGGTR
jgi:isopentenyl diphosphate isomerase/L-lactate dehydrogenase-like FMN-dependent dehydrogenase